MYCLLLVSHFFFFNDTATTEIYTLSLHDALPIYRHPSVDPLAQRLHHVEDRRELPDRRRLAARDDQAVESTTIWKLAAILDRKSTRLNSSHQIISYAVFCLKKKKVVTPPVSYTQP